MRPLRESLRRLLDAHEPNPALVVDGLWSLIEANSAASLLWEGVDPELLEPPVNMLRLGVHPGGLPAISSMTAACSAPLVHRLRRKARDDADEALGALLDEIEVYLPPGPQSGVATQPVSRSTSTRGSATCVSSRSSPGSERRWKSRLRTWPSRRSCPPTRRVPRGYATSRSRWCPLPGPPEPGRRAWATVGDGLQMGGQTRLARSEGPSLGESGRVGGHDDEASARRASQPPARARTYERVTIPHAGVSSLCCVFAPCPTAYLFLSRARARLRRRS